MIPIIRPSNPPLKELEGELQQILASGQITVGPQVKAFEETVRKVTGTRCAVATGSCTAGLMLLIKALDIKGDVLIPTFTFTASVQSLVWNGCRPIFVDSDPATGNLDIADLEKKITPQTTACCPVYVYGMPPDLDEVEAFCRRQGLLLYSDAAQGLGATYKRKAAGGFGQAEVFSFSPTKVVTAVEAGVVATDDETLAERLRYLRDYGKAPDGQEINDLGLSARLSEVHALIGKHNMARLGSNIEKRAHWVKRYREALGQLPGVSFPAHPADRSTSHNYMVLFLEPGQSRRSRDQVYQALKDQGIQTKKYFYPCVHQQVWLKKIDPAFSKLCLPQAEALAAKALALPLYNDFQEKEFAAVVQAVTHLLS